MKLLKSLPAFIALCILTACHPTDERLQRIDSMLSIDADSVVTSYTSAIAALDSIDPDTLSPHNRNLYNLLSVKARDKAYITHTSDSVVPSMLSWFATHSTDRYPEALYYAGRIYSDLGDKSTAIAFFQDALDKLPEGNSYLRICLTSQTGRLLSGMMLNSQAAPYLEESLRLAEEANHPLVAYDYQLLGANYIDEEDYANAERYIAAAIEKAANLPEGDQAIMQGYMAVLRCNQKRYEEALKLISSVPDRAPHEGNARDFFNSYKAKIFLKLGQLDSAYIYSMMNINSPEISYRTTAYYRLFSPELRPFIPSDSLYIYLNRYVQAQHERYEHHDADGVILQNAVYNYSLHQRNSEQLQSKNRTLVNWLYAASALILLLIIIVLVLRHRHARMLLSLHSSLSAVEALEHNGSLPPKSDASDADALRAQIMAKLEQQSQKGLPQLPASLLSSPAYLAVKQRLEKADSIKSGEWSDIEQTMSEYFPSFLENLTILSSGTLKLLDRRLAMLIKLQFSPTQISTLMACQKGSVTYHLNSLLKSILPHISELKALDPIIHIL